MSGRTKSSKKPVNLADIAREVGVSMMTVSLALRDDKRISARTKKKVQAKAQEMGYVRDPELSRLMAYIRQRQGKNHQANLGFLHCLPPDFSKHSGEYLWGLYDAAREHASDLGYSLNLISLVEKGMSKRRITQILQTRNLQGVIVAPVPGEQDFQPGDRFDPGGVAGVNIGYSVTNPRYSRVTINHYQAINMAMDKLWERGYRRIGLALDAISSARVRDLWLAGFAAWQYTHFRRMRVPPLVVTSEWADAMSEWLADFKPDVILTQTMRTQDTLRDLGHDVPSAIGVAYLNANFQGPEVGGIVQDVRAEARLAIEYLISQILARKAGVPEDNVTSMIKASWRDGPTFRRAEASTAASPSAVEPAAHEG